MASLLKCIIKGSRDLNDTNCLKKTFCTVKKGVNTLWYRLVNEEVNT